MTKQKSQYKLYRNRKLVGSSVDPIELVNNFTDEAGYYKLFHTDKEIVLSEFLIEEKDRKNKFVKLKIN